MTPWWSESFSIWIGAVGGGGGGALAGIFGSAIGVLAPRGIARTPVLTAHVLLLAVGVVSLASGIVAVSLGQPYHVWFPLTSIGVVLSVVMGGLLPVVRNAYARAEVRRMEAERLRRG